MVDYREIARHIKEAAGGVSTKSAMNPVLWLSAILAIPAFIASLISPEPYKFYFFALGCGVAVIALFSYLFLLFFDREKLQDEEFRLKDKALTIFGDSSSGKPGMDTIIHGQTITPRMIEQRASGNGQPGGRGRE